MYCESRAHVLFVMRLSLANCPGDLKVWCLDQINEVEHSWASLRRMRFSMIPLCRLWPEPAKPWSVRHVQYCVFTGCAINEQRATSNERQAMSNTGTPYSVFSKFIRSKLQVCISAHHSSKFNKLINSLPLLPITLIHCLTPFLFSLFKPSCFPSLAIASRLRPE
jgi:hypothetical protein